MAEDANHEYLQRAGNARDPKNIATRIKNMATTIPRLIILDLWSKLYQQKLLGPSNIEGGKAASCAALIRIILFENY
jgi:hypothetical protein